MRAPAARLPSLIGDGVLQAMQDMAASTPPGCFVEVGVWKGGSAQFLLEVAQEQHRKLFLYDTFTGIPYTSKQHGDTHVVGDFSDTSYEAVRAAFPPEVSITQGIFPASAVSMPTVAFVHLDCDQYWSVKDSCQYLIQVMVKGGVIWFDDPQTLAGAMRAAREMFGDDLKQHACEKHYWVKP